MRQVSSISLLILLGLGRAVGFQVSVVSSLLQSSSMSSSSSSHHNHRLQVKLHQHKHAHSHSHSHSHSNNEENKTTSDRRSILSQFANGVTASAATLALGGININVGNGNGNVNVANAAPPIAIIAEELGYFPVTNRAGETKYVPARVRRKSSEQSIALAQHLKNIGAVMYGSYWCPHCAHQKELFGAEAWNIIPYVECSMKGFYYDNDKVEKVFSKIDGFPTWYIPSSGSGSMNVLKRKNADWVSGEMPLERLVALSDYKGSFDVLLEGPEVGISSGSCR